MNIFKIPLLFLRRTLLFFLVVFCIFYRTYAQEKYTVSGYLKNNYSGETLFGATIYIKEIGGGVVTNEYGFYSITLPQGNYTLAYRYIGFVTKIVEVSLDKDYRLDIDLIEAQTNLEEVEISSEREDANVTSTEMSVSKLDISSVRKLPSFLGEPDVIKSLQLLPGVTSVGEGASGFNVRGGSVSHNLVLLDEAPIYNSSHLLGFFSVFNPDVVKNIKLYKGGMPARYGGRISSVLDIVMKKGNDRKLSVYGGLGTIFSRFAIEGPIKKGKSSFLLAGRRSYADILIKPFTNVLDDGAGLYFYDLTSKLNYSLSKKDNVFLSAYLGRDVFNFDSRQGIQWGSQTVSLRWNHLFTDRLFSNLSLLSTRYDYELAFGATDSDRFQWESNIFTYNIKPEFTYFISTKNELTFGGEALLYLFEPANAQAVNSGEIANFDIPKKQALEYAIYINDQVTFSDKWSAQFGLRVSGFNYLGSGNYYTFLEDTPGFRKTVDKTASADKGETIKQYIVPEPRISIKYQINATSSIKTSFNRTSQYIHLLSNTTAANPLDIWTPSTNNIKPQIGQQFALGYFRNFLNNNYEMSVETYYRNIQNQLDFIDGADLFFNELIEADVLSGVGRAYGLELYLKKNEGKITGWASYTLGKTELKIDGINYQEDIINRKGEWYPTRYDQTHNLKLVGFYNVSERVSLSANFVYISGTPGTFPTHRYQIEHLVIPDNVKNSRNNLRIPDYHRLDISMTLKRKTMKKGKIRKNTAFWTFTISNVYARKNPFSIYFWQGQDRFLGQSPVTTKATQISILGSILPSVNYNFKF